MTLADATQEFTRMLPGICNVERQTDGALDGFGNPARTWANIAKRIKCSVQPQLSFSSWSEQSQANELSVYEFLIALEKSDCYTPTPEDRITNYSVDGETQSFTYELGAVLDPAGRNNHWFCGADRVVDV